MEFVWVSGFLGLLLAGCACGFDLNRTEVVFDGEMAVGTPPLFVPLTLIQSAAAKGAVCLDGSLPGYHLHRGFGYGANSWLVQLEGGGWCNDIPSCLYRKKSRRGSSYYMEKQLQFTGILSDKPEENPDFYNWNRVRVRYCDGASFLGEGYNMAAGLFFRGQRIWLAAMEDLISKGMRNANQALLTGCSAGGLAAIHHCDGFRSFFPGSTKIKCLADAGLFLDAVDVARRRTLRSFFGGVVNLQGLSANLPRTCTSRLNPILCFFPQNVLSTVQTPLFLLNSGYDVWQLQESLATKAADPHGYWHDCKMNNAKCNTGQIQFLQGFRNQMLNYVERFSLSSKNGLFINSCFAHCQSERQDTWFGNNSPSIRSKTDVVLPSLEDQGVRQLYPKGPNIDYKKELRSLNRELQLHILELADVLVERPSQYARRVEEISLIFKNLHHLLNSLRPHQARATLTHILERQIQRRKQAVEDIKRSTQLIDQKHH